MNSLAYWIVMVLCTWRISNLLIYENGPFDIFEKLRVFVGIRYDEFSNPYANNVIGKLFLCIWCISVWVGALIAIPLLFNGFLWYDYLIILFSLSAGSILLDKVIKNI